MTTTDASAVRLAQGGSPIEAATEVRQEIIERLATDLLGPQSPDERIRRDKPSDRYLTGILFPQRVPVAPEEDESLEAQGDDDESTTGSERDAVPLMQSRRPAAAGISFAVASTGVPSIDVRIRCGTYKPAAPADLAGNETAAGEPSPGAGTPPDSDSAAAAASSVADAPDGQARTKRGERPDWIRTQHDVHLRGIALHPTPAPVELGAHGINGLQLHFHVVPWSGGHLVTASLVNRHDIADGEGRDEIEQRSFFQTELIVFPAEKTRLPARPSRRPATDEDGEIAALLYRDAREYAVGHTCSAEWESGSDDSAKWVRTTWLPVAEVPAVSPAGGPHFASLGGATGIDPLSASALAAKSGTELARALAELPDAYARWIEQQRRRIPDLPEALRPVALRQLERCEDVCRRMRQGVDLVGSDARVCMAFRLANQAMVIQRTWARPGDADLRWRPFQLGFLLLALASLVDPDHVDRGIMDLLWFPTGGGKTEAYLGLVAILLFHRRLRNEVNPDEGAGVAAIMRYTLRLLTTQQFQRAAALVLACELLRRGDGRPAGCDVPLGNTPFAIGLWVGDDAVANRFEDAASALGGASDQHRTPAQVQHCPCCRKRLRWSADRANRQIVVECQNSGCRLASSGDQLPIWTVDDDVYGQRPSLLIGTVDKFAQVVRNKHSGALLGTDGRNPPPDLIIQDELHLISGPLGTMTALYEAMVDLLCSRDGRRPKVIGSTATIRRADEQVRNLFDRTTCQFPPPGLDAADSGFAVPDPTSPGRRYVGVTTAGRSPKFTLQAISASLLQSGGSPRFTDASRDAYWTLVTYFNSLRELGGAVVLMRDDVPASLSEYAARRSEEVREVRTLDELTSRVSQTEVRDKLTELEESFSSGNAIDVLLASNMISVGVDISRLGMMIVNGQPKGIAEYIQATSRVGRGGLAGLVVTAYNSGKARDRSHFESFATWHQTLYREVEATSVTPFASRSRDRALHGIMVGALRHTLAEMLASPSLTPRGKTELRRIADFVVARAARIDAEEKADVERQFQRIIDDWDQRAGVERYWDDRRRNTSLLMSAEKAAALRAAGRPSGLAWPTPNSMRNVEPGTRFALVERLRTADGADNAE